MCIRIGSLIEMKLQYRYNLIEYQLIGKTWITLALPEHDMSRTFMIKHGISREDMIAAYLEDMLRFAMH